MLSRLWTDKAGNFGMLTAFAMLVLCGTAGLAVDYSTAFARRATLQAAADSAVLSVAGQGLSGQGTIQRALEKAFFANINGYLAGISRVEPVVVTPDRRVRMVVTATMPLTLGALFLPDGFTLHVAAAAEKEVPGAADIALVLDTTASMQGQKIADLKAATHSLLKVFSDSGTSKARFALVPFSDYVNVGVSKRGSSWINVPEDSAVTKKKVCTSSAPLIGKSGCSMQPQVTFRDGVPTTAMREICTKYIYGESTTRCQDQVTTYTWSGCVGSRNAPLDTSDDAPDRRYPGIQNVTCGSPVTPLSADYRALSSAVARLTVQNNTYIPAGLLWGLNVLSPTEPFTEARTTPASAPRFMVLLTDGDNSLRALYPTHGGAISGNGTNDARTRTSANDTTISLCNAIKARGITLFTVAVGDLLPSSTSLLRDCASDPEKAIAVKDSARLVKVFNDIAGAMMVTRLTE